MVKLGLIALVFAAGVAHADPTVDRRVGWDFAVGGLSDKTFAFGLGLDLDQRVAGAWFVTAAYHWRWTERTLTEMTSTPGSAQAIDLGVRRRLTASHRFEPLTLFVDGEAGIGAELATDDRGSRAVPEAYAGLRFGYQLTELHSSTPQRGFDFDFAARAIAIDHGPEGHSIGGMFVMTMAWDD
jgi:hypothetical protein